MAYCDSALIVVAFDYYNDPIVKKREMQKRQKLRRMHVEWFSPWINLIVPKASESAGKYSEHSLK